MNTVLHLEVTILAHERLIVLDDAAERKLSRIPAT